MAKKTRSLPKVFAEERRPAPTTEREDRQPKYSKGLRVLAHSAYIAVAARKVLTSFLESHFRDGLQRLCARLRRRTPGVISG